MRTLLFVAVVSCQLAAQQPKPSIAVHAVADVAAGTRFLGTLGFRPTGGTHERPTLRRGRIVLTLEAGTPNPRAQDQAIVVSTRDPARLAARVEGADLPGVVVSSCVDTAGRRDFLVRDGDGWRFVIRKAGTKPTAVPALGELNPIVVEVMGGYPTDGTHGYYWPRSGDWKGCTRDLAYQGTVIARGDPQHRCFCCGLTFEVFLRAWTLWCRRTGRPEAIADLDPNGVRRLQRQWFGSSTELTCVHAALTTNSLGVRVTNLDDATPGDFVQLWRHDGTGHSVIFLEWVRDDGSIKGMRYWSTQRSTRGIGRRTELFGKQGHTIDESRLWICRVGLPPTNRGAAPGRHR